MWQNKFLLSTVSDLKYNDINDWPGNPENCMDTVLVAKEYGMGLEIAEFCNSALLDETFKKTDEYIRRKIKDIKTVILHAPFNEIYPSAIDKKVAEHARFRLGQAYEAAVSYGAKKMVVHSGFVPVIYYESWFEECSVKFWKEFSALHPGSMEICIENVMEKSPDVLCSIIKRLDDDRIKLTLDIGHANVVNGEPLQEWIKKCAPYISHYHIHNNKSEFDTHDALDDGDIDMKEILMHTSELTPDATYTIECAKARRCAQWLKDNGF